MEEAVTNFDLFLLFWPIVVIAIVGSYWVIRYNDALPMPDESEWENDDHFNNG